MAAGIIDGAGADPAHGFPWIKRGLGWLWAHRWIALATALAIAIGGWQGAHLLMGPLVPVDVVKRGRLLETVVATGNVETLFRADIGSQITGTVAAVLVDEGQRVTAGQPLIALESGELKAAVAQARGALDGAEAHMRQLAELTLPTARETLKDAQATMLNMRQTYDRTAQLSANGYATRAALDAARRDLDVARTQVKSGEVAVSTAASGGSDYLAAQTQIDQARANLTTAQARLGYTMISAPRTGVLINRAVERGAVVQPGVALMVLAPDGDTLLRLEIDERNLGKLRLGQTAVASADAYPDKKFAATVTYVNPSVDISRASIEVRLTVGDPPPAYLRQDMTVSVDIEVGQSANALMLPGRSVHDALSANPWVMLVKGGRATRRPAHLGLIGATRIEILDGVAEGDRVIPATSPIVAGQRMRAQAP